MPEKYKLLLCQQCLELAMSICKKMLIQKKDPIPCFGKCTYLQLLLCEGTAAAEKMREVARHYYMTFFQTKSLQEEQLGVIMAWIGYTSAPNHQDGSREGAINALGTMGITKYADQHLATFDNLTRTKKGRLETRDDLTAYMELIKLFAERTPTRVVRELAGASLRVCCKDEILDRLIYKHYEDTSPANPPKTIYSLGKFLLFWKENFPHLKLLGKPKEDAFAIPTSLHQNLSSVLRLANLATIMIKVSSASTHPLFNSQLVLSRTNQKVEEAVKDTKGCDIRGMKNDEQMKQALRTLDVKQMELFKK
eukprot:jgi/Psemu1/8366/gm1.8366_g